MSIAVFPSPKPFVPSEALANQLLEAARQELDALRATLEQSLAQLETALDNPDACESVERLVLNLARLAIDESAANNGKPVKVDYKV